ncbi:MAG: ferrochelatase, partial [Actinomycetota bacterium]|nr:ferrochelatase [Actinomycetota bacterium]
DVEAYYTDIRHGRPPPPDLLHELRERYRAIGGVSPLLQITRAQAQGIADRSGINEVYIGQKHARPFIPDAITKMKENHVDRAVGIVLAPHFSTMSIGDYKRRARRAVEETGWQGRLDIVDNWHLEPGYIDFLTREVSRALSSLPEASRDQAVVLFTAHSLPEKILQAGDPYPRQLEESARAVATQAGLNRWQVGWQSAGRTDVPWLGPDILEILPRLATEKVPGVVICPCGFVADHLEVLYDIDIEAQQKARELGIDLVRTASPNDDPLFLDTLATVARRALSRE